MEEATAEEKRVCDVLKRDGDMSAKKEKTLAVALEAVDRDIAAFQLEKQAKLNKLHTLVPLKLHQILYFSMLSCCTFAATHRHVMLF